jgi:hypothetical protein
MQTETIELAKSAPLPANLEDEDTQIDHSSLMEHHCLQRLEMLNK